MSDARPILSLAILARDKEAAATLERCLRSLTERDGGPIASEIVVMSGGDPCAEVKRIATSHKGVRWADAPADLPRSKDGGIGDFAAWRNYSFSLLSGEWVGYVDADDVWPSAARVAEVRAKDARLAAIPFKGDGPSLTLQEWLKTLPPDVDRVEYRYHYAIDDADNVTNAQDVVRIVRAGRGFRFRNDAGKVHECLFNPGPVGRCISLGAATFVEHRPARSYEERALRNEALMEAAIAAGEDSWPLRWFQARNAEGRRELAGAIAHDKAALPLARSPMDRIASILVIARNLRILGRADEAMEFALLAHMHFPDRREPVAQVVECCAALGLDAECAMWYQRLLSLPEGEGVLGVSRVAYETDLWPHLAAAKALERLKRVPLALEAARRAAAFAPYDIDSRDAVERLEDALDRERLHAAAELLIAEAEKHDPAAVNALIEALPIDLGEDFRDRLNIGQRERAPTARRAFLEAAYSYPIDGYLPAVVRVEETEAGIEVELEETTGEWPNGGDLEGPTVDIYAPNAVEPWDAFTPERHGIGGSEEMLVWLARHLATKCRRVRVYARTERFHVDRGVQWEPLKNFRPHQFRDVLIAHRDPSVLLRDDIEPMTRRIAWLHDLVPPHRAWDDARVHLVVAVSEWHARWLEKERGIQPGKIRVAVNVPADLDAPPADPGARDPRLAVYASAPFRGLERLLRLWPKVRERVPDAALHVCYGWKVHDFLAKHHPALRAQKEAILRLLEQPGVVWRGGLNEGDLRALLQRASVLAYPSTYDETSCRVAIRAMACGAIPYTSGRAALHETCGGFGQEWESDDEYVNALALALKHERCNTYRAAMALHGADFRTRAKAAWDAILELAPPAPAPVKEKETTHV